MLRNVKFAAATSSFILTVILSGSGAAIRPCDGASFTPLGFLNVGNGPSLGLGVSADGSTVVGESNSPQGLQAFRWRAGEGMIGLGDIPGGFFASIAYACSGDGSIVVGASEDATSGEDGTPFRWTEQSGMVRLGTLGGPTSYGQAEGITPDGSVIVGASQAPDGIFAFRWTQAGGMVSLGDLAGGPAFSRANGVSADGNVIVGTGSVNSGLDQAFRWTPGGGMVGIGSNNSAHAVTPDGQVIAGVNFQGAYRWTQSGGFVRLGNNPDGTGGVQLLGAMSADGNVIVGLADYNGTQGTGEAFIWDPTHGMRDLNRVLVNDYHLDLQGMFLFFAEGISADGKVIAGYGFDQQGEQEAWVVNLEEQSGVGSPGMKPTARTAWKAAPESSSSGTSPIRFPARPPSDSGWPRARTSPCACTIRRVA